MELKKVENFGAAFTGRGEQPALESGIDIEQGINIGPGNFSKDNKRRALNKCRASEF